MATQITYDFEVQVTGIFSVNATRTALAAVAIDKQTLGAFWGLRVTSDVVSTVAGNRIRRRIICTMGPSVVALATPNVDKSVLVGGVLSYTITQNGLDYIRPPVVSVADTAPGIGSGASAYAQMGVWGVTVNAGGAGYSAATIVTPTGGELAPGGVQATFTPNLVGAAVNTVTVNTPGGPYNYPPTLTVSDTGGGSGAVLTAQLGVNALVVLATGKSYSNPTVAFTPWFKTLVPDTFPLAQAASVAGWMQQIIQNAIGCPVQPSAGVVA